MAEGEAEYAVEYLDTAPEETNWLKRAGSVKITYPNGDIFEGLVNEAKLKDGEGKYTWMEQTEEGPQIRALYAGTYVAGQKVGLGKMTFPNGDSYHGLWEADVMAGEGTYVYANGDIYSGTFVKGIKEGRGTYEYAADQSQLVGKWEKNAIVEGVWKFQDGTEYHGKFENGKPIGPGVFQLTNGLHQEGEYIKSVAEDDESKVSYSWAGSKTVKACA